MTFLLQHVNFHNAASCTRQAAFHGVAGDLACGLVAYLPHRTETSVFGDHWLLTIDCWSTQSLKIPRRTSGVPGRVPGFVSLKMRRAYRVLISIWQRVPIPCVRPSGRFLAEQTRAFWNLTFKSTCEMTTSDKNIVRNDYCRWNMLKTCRTTTLLIANMLKTHRKITLLKSIKGNTRC